MLRDQLLLAMMRDVTWVGLISPIWVEVKASAWVLDSASSCEVLMPLMLAVPNAGMPVVSDSAAKLVVLSAG